MIFNTVGLHESEWRKALKKAKKAEAKNDKNDKEDRFGQKYVSGVDHLKEACKFIEPLLKYYHNDVESLILGCRVYFAQSKFALM
jgi:hypothetical protein